MCHEVQRVSKGGIWGWVVNTMPQLLYSWKTNHVPTAQEDRPQGWYGQMWKTLPKPGFEGRTIQPIQPIANHYTDYTNPAH